MTVTTTLVKEAPAGLVSVEGVSSDAIDAHPLAAYLRATGFEAEPGTHRAVPNTGAGEGERDAPVTIIVGLGADDERDPDTYRKVGGALARAAKKYEEVAVDVLGAVGDLAPAAAARALAEGIGLGRYAYTVLKTDPTPSSLTTVHVVGKGGKRVQAALDLGSAVAEAVCVARDLVNEPGGSLTPPAFADEAVSLGRAYGFEVTVLDEDAIREARMGGLLGVNRGSELPPRFLELRWTPSGKPRGVVALVGKGITFDSGGLSLKPSEGMVAMKSDMGGGAAVVGAFCALRAADPKVEVRGYVPLTDNMTGGDATRLGDVLTISNGTTVEIHNTDAEGRLVLADALTRATEGGPDAIVDLATLTGACMVALGNTHAGLFGTNLSWIEQVTEAAGASGEQVWHLPLPDAWRKQLDSDVADMKNVGGRYGGASVAALFLRDFVGEGIPWVHLDIAGPAFVDTETVLETKGGTGYGVRTLVSLLESYRRPTKDQ